MAGNKKLRLFGVSQLSYLLISTLALVPQLCSVNFAIETSKETQIVYYYIEDVLADGKNVLVDIHYGESLRPALEPLLVVLTKHLFDKNCKIIFVSTSTSGSLMFEKLRSLASNIFAVKQYGFDYVFLGKIDHNRTAVESLATSIRQTLDRDYYNNSVTDYVRLPIMKNVDEAEDFAAVFILSIETEIFEWYACYWAACGVPLIIGTLKVVAPLLENYMRNRQVIGIIAGCDAVAGYEILVNEAGRGFAAIKNRNMAYVLAAAFMLIANIIIFCWELKPKSLSRPKPIEHG